MYQLMILEIASCYDFTIYSFFYRQLSIHTSLLYPRTSQLNCHRIAMLLLICPQVPSASSGNVNNSFEFYSASGIFLLLWALGFGGTRDTQPHSTHSTGNGDTALPLFTALPLYRFTALPLYCFTALYFMQYAFQSHKQG
jgi:hypothetical protein